MTACESCWFSPNMIDYTAVTVAISLLSVMANLLLLFLFFRCSLKTMRGFKYFFFFTALQDLVYTVCFLAQVPKVITRDFTFILISTGPLRAPPGGMIFLALFCLTTISSLVFVANNFLYRYIQLCRHQYLYLYSTKKVVLLGVLINLLIIGNWMLMIRLCFWPNDALVSVAEILWAAEELEVAGHSYIGMTNYDGANPFLMILLVESLTLLFTLATISPCCAVRIHRNLKENSLSDYTKKLHRQMLKLLVIQTACPAVFMHAPLSLMLLLLLSGITSPPALTYIIGILIAIFPLSIPITIILCVKEYRDFFIPKWGRNDMNTTSAARFIATTTLSRP